MGEAARRWRCRYVLRSAPVREDRRGVAPGEAKSFPTKGPQFGEPRRCRGSANAGALAFKRSGDPNIGSFADATILKTFGEVPENLDEL